MAEGQLRERIVATVNILGSVASITGVSLLWLRGRDPFGVEEILSVAVTASFALGLLTVGVFLVRRIEARRIRGQGEVALWGYRLLAYPIVLVVSFLILLTTNKILLSFPLDWFLRPS
jgi:hypothetical protein